MSLFQGGFGYILACYVLKIWIEHHRGRLEQRRPWQDIVMLCIINDLLSPFAFFFSCSVSILCVQKSTSLDKEFGIIIYKRFLFPNLLGKHLVPHTHSLKIKAEAATTSRDLTTSYRLIATLLCNSVIQYCPMI